MSNSGLGTQLAQQRLHLQILGGLHTNLRNDTVRVGVRSAVRPGGVVAKRGEERVDDLHGEDDGHVD